MRSRFTVLFLFSTLACASCAALVAMMLVANPPVVHMSPEMAMEQLGLIGLGLLVMFFLILSLVVLMRMRRRVKQIHQVLAKYSHAQMGERVIDVRSSDDLGMLEYRVNRLLDIVDVFIRDKHAGISEEKDPEYYHSVVNTPLSNALQEIKTQLAFDYAESSMDKHLKDAPMASAGAGDGDAIDTLLDEDHELLSTVYSSDDAVDALCDAEVEDFEFDALEESEVSDRQMPPIPAAQEEGLQTVSEKGVDESEQAVRDDCLASFSKFSTLSTYMRDALETFYNHIGDYNDEVSKRQRANDKAQQKLKKEFNIVSKSHSLLKRDLTKVLDSLPKDDREVWEASDAMSPEDALRKGIEQVSVMAKQVRMYTLGALAQAEKHEGMGDGFKQAAQEIRDLANESDEAAKVMDKALKAFKEKSDSIQEERAAMHELTDVLHQMKEALPDRSFSYDEAFVEQDESHASLAQLDEMMSVLRAATDAMKDESEELAGRLAADSSEAA